MTLPGPVFEATLIVVVIVVAGPLWHIVCDEGEAVIPVTQSVTKAKDLDGIKLLTTSAIIAKTRSDFLRDAQLKGNKIFLR